LKIKSLFAKKKNEKRKKKVWVQLQGLKQLQNQLLMQNASVHVGPKI
jgi:hypothetical protein